MSFINQKIDKFLKKVNTYDKANWEIIVENYKTRSNLESLDSAKGNLHLRNLIDIDLFRGKHFQKAKPIYDWYNVTIKAFFRSLFYPFYHSWWIDQLGFKIFLLFLFVYISELVVYFNFCFNAAVRKNFTFLEANSSILFSIYLSEIFNHVVAKNLTRPIHVKSYRSKDMHTFRSVSSVDLASSYYKQNLSTCPVRRRSKHRRKGSRDATSLINSDHETNLMKQTISKDTVSFHRMKHYDYDEQNAELNETEMCVNDSTTHLTHSSSSLSECDEKDQTFIQNVISKPEKFYQSKMLNKTYIQEEVMATFFESQGLKKTKISIWDIVTLIEDRVNASMLQTTGFAYFLTVNCLYFSLLPYLFELTKLFHNQEISPWDLFWNPSVGSAFNLLMVFFRWFRESESIVVLDMILVIGIRFTLVGSFFFLLCVVERTYLLRYLYGKYFSAVTSTRRAKRNHIPHFRLHKVKNIKAWLSLRSYLRKCGPLKSIDLIVSSIFFLTITLVVFVCATLLLDINSQPGNRKDFSEEYLYWEVFSWSILLSYFLLKLVSSGAEINRKYNNHSELLTEQINLYLQMEVCPQKKEEFIIANNVLKLASKLIKEVESPQNVSGIIINPLLRNIIRVVILSLVSGVISELFGVSFKFWKIRTA